MHEDTLTYMRYRRLFHVALTMGCPWMSRKNFRCVKKIDISREARCGTEISSHLKDCTPDTFVTWMHPFSRSATMETRKERTPTTGDVATLHILIVAMGIVHVKNWDRS